MTVMAHTQTPGQGVNQSKQREDWCMDIILFCWKTKDVVSKKLVALELLVLSCTRHNLAASSSNNRSNDAQASTNDAN